MYIDIQRYGYGYGNKDVDMNIGIMKRYIDIDILLDIEIFKKR